MQFKATFGHPVLDHQGHPCRMGIQCDELDGVCLSFEQPDSVDGIIPAGVEFNIGEGDTVLELHHYLTLILKRWGYTNL